MMLPLKGIRILDLTRMVAGPMCAMLLGDLGAEVIKIENPGKGDDSRKWGPNFVNGESAYFLSVNRHKKAITLDFKKEKAKQIFRELVKSSDVIIENFRTGTMERFGLGYETLTKLNPRLIYCSVTGFGLSGPYKTRPGTDPILQAVGGLMGITGEPDGKPMRVPTPIIDMATGIYAHGAVMGALMSRTDTGKGCHLEFSLLDTQLMLLLSFAGNYLNGGTVPQRQGTSSPSIVPFGIFETKDRDIFISASADIRWQRLCRACSLEHMIDDPKFSTASARVENKEELVRLLQNRLYEKSADEWLALIQNELPSSAINTMDRVFSDPHVMSRGMVADVTHPFTGAMKLVGIPMRCDGVRGEIRLPPPRLGEHNHEILEELGYDESTIEKLKAEGVI
jgi:formyl-CoA transferase/CoA:oxalate CoA-transferase